MLSLRTPLQKAPVLWSGLALLAVSLHWWHPGAVIMQGDSVYFPSPFVQLQSSIAAWNHSASLVGGWQSTCSYAMLLVVAGLLQVAFGYDLSQIVLLWALIFGSWFAAYALARRLGALPIAAAIAAWFYAVNPWSEQFYAYNYQLEVLAILVPLVGIWILNVDQQPRGRLSFKAFLVGAIPASLFGVNPALIALALVCVVPFVPLSLALSHRRKYVAVECALALVAGIAGSLWWLIPVAWADVHSVVTAQLSPDAWSWVTAHSSLLNNFRFTPTWWWRSDYVPYMNAIDGNPVLYGSQFVGIALMLIALVVVRDPRARFITRYCGLIVLLALWVSKGLHPPGSWVNEMFYRLPGAFLFREPTTKVPLAALTFLVAPAALAIDTLVRTARLSSGIRRIAITAVAITVAAAGYPSLTGVVFHDATDAVPGLYAYMPSYWRSAANAVNADPVPGAVLMLPFEQFYQMDYGWFYGADYIADWLMARPVVHLGVDNFTYTVSTAELAIERRLAGAIASHDPSLRQLLRNLGVRYVLVRGDVFVRPEYRAGLSDVEYALGRYPHEHFGPLTLIRLSDTSAKLIESTSPLLQTNARDAGLASALQAANPRVRISYNAESANAFPGAPLEAIDQDGPAGISLTSLATTGRAVSAVMKGGRLQWAVGHATAGLPRVVRTMNQLGRFAPAPARPTIAILDTQYNENTRQRYYEVFNPARAIVYADVDVVVHDREPMRYQIQSEVGKSAISATTSPTLSWVTIPAVAIPSGRSQLRLSWNPSRSARMQFPRRDTTGALLGATYFRVKTYATLPDIAMSKTLTLPTSRDHVLLGTVAVGRSLEQKPAFALGVGTSTIVGYFGVIWEVSVGAKRFYVYQHAFASNVVIDASEPIEQALEENGVNVTRSALRLIRVENMSVDVGGYEAPHVGDPGFTSLSLEWSEPSIRPIDISRRGSGSPSRILGLGSHTTFGGKTAWGRPVVSLISDNFGNSSAPTLEVFNPSKGPLAVVIHPILSSALWHEEFRLSSGRNIIRLTMPPNVVHRLRIGEDQLGFTSVMIGGAAPPRTVKSGRVRFSSALPHVFVGSIPLSVPLAANPTFELTLSDRTSLVAFMGVVWSVSVNGHLYAIYQHEYRSGLILDVVPEIADALRRNGITNDALRDGAVIVGANIDAQQYGHWHEGDVIVKETSIYPQHSLILRYQAARPMVAPGIVGIKLCGAPQGGVSVILDDGDQSAHKSFSVDPGSMSALAPREPEVGIQLPARPQVYRNVTVAYTPLDQASDNASCRLQVNYIPQVETAKAILSVDGREYAMKGNAGSILIANDGSHRVSLQPGPPSTEFATVYMPNNDPGKASMTPWSRKFFAGFVVRATGADSRASRVIATPEAYDQAWSGLVLENGVHVPVHLMVDGWRDGYIVHGGDILVVVNRIVLIQGLAGLFALVGCVISIVQLTRKEVKAA